MKKVFVTVTANEKNVLDTLIGELYAEAGFSDVDCADLARITKTPVASIKGTIGSLVKKGLVATDEMQNFGLVKTKGGYKSVIISSHDLIYLSSDAYNLHPVWCEEAEVETVITVS